MAPALWKGLVGVGLFALAHAALSAAQHRSYVRLAEKEGESPPVDIVVQTLVAFAVTCVGVVRGAGDFRDTDATAELKTATLDAWRSRPAFHVFNHRGRVLSRPPEPSNPSSLDAPPAQTPLKSRKPESLRR